MNNMNEYDCMRIIEALRSGVSSRCVGEYFSAARPKILEKINNNLIDAAENKRSNGIIISGKYGEGKTHLLNTAFNMAHEKNMVVSIISLSKETPFDKLFHVYSKLLHHTYLPKRVQPGFEHELSKLTPNSDISLELLDIVKSELEMDKIFYLLKSYINTDDENEKFLFQADLEGDFINNVSLKQIYKRIFNETLKFNLTFNKTNYMDDYFSFLSNLFLKLGYSGWLILFDEVELIGKLGKKARLNAYKNMSKFLYPDLFSKMKSTFTIFALSASYNADVIETKKEFDNLESSDFKSSDKTVIQRALESIVSAEQLQPLTESEMYSIFEKVQMFHAKAYNWNPTIDISDIINSTKSSGYLLRNKIRGAVEYLDQMYQYGEASDIVIDDLSIEEYVEEED